MGDVTVINLTNAPINTAISAVFNYNWRNIVSPDQYVVLDAKGVVTLSAKWGLGETSYYTADSAGIGFFAVGTALAVAGLVLAIPTGGVSLNLTLAASLVISGVSLPVGVLGFAIKDFINTPAAVRGIELRQELKYVVEGEVEFEKNVAKGLLKIVGETKGRELKLRQINDKEFLDLQAKGIGPMDLAYEVGHGACTISTPFVTSDGWVWFQDQNSALMRMRREGTGAPEHIGKNYIASSPVVFGDWVYFLGLNGALMRMKTDGSAGGDIGSNIAFRYGDTKQGCAPSLDSQGRLWFWGKNNALMWTNLSGTDGGNPDGAYTMSSPVVFGDWVYFLGWNGALTRMKTDGSAGGEIGNNKGALGMGGNPSPIVDRNGYVWFWGANRAVMKTNQAGTRGGNPGGAYSSSAPTVFGDWVYYEGLNGKLMCMMTDGSSGGDRKVEATIQGTPFVAPDGWVFFRGRNDLLMRACFHESPQLREG